MEDARAAALVIGNPEVFLGSDFINGSKIKVQLLSKECPEAQPVVGFRLVFPFEPSPSKGHCYSESGKETRNYTITVKFPLGQFTWSIAPIPAPKLEMLKSRLAKGQDVSKLRAATFSIRKDFDVDVEDFGKPFVGRDAEVGSGLTLNTVICGAKLLVAIASWKRFLFVIEDEDAMRSFFTACSVKRPEWQGYPFGQM